MTKRVFGRKALSSRGALLAAFGFAMLAGAIPAAAADAVTEEIPAAPAVPMEEPPVASWAGAYAGLDLGYGFGGEVKTDGDSADTDGFVGGAFAGVQGQSGQVVYGLEGDVGYSGLKGEDDGIDTEGGVEGSLRARLGYAVTPEVLVYGTAGGAAQRLTVEEGGVEDSRGVIGYTVGAGTDVKITDNVFGRVEYRYTDFGSRSFDLGSGSQDVDSANHRVIFGVGMSF